MSVEAPPRVDPRIEKRRAAVEGERRGRHRRWFLALAVVVTLGAGAQWLTHSAALDVDRFVVRGTERVTPETVVAASGVRLGSELVSLDAAGAERGIDAVPWVAQARFERQWNGTITITIVERAPSVRLRVDARGSAERPRVLVDATGRVLGPADATELPEIEGVASVGIGSPLGSAALPLVAVAGSIPESLRSRVDVVRPGSDGVEMAIRPGGVVRLGSADRLDQKMRSLVTVFAQVDLRCLATVDVRVPDAPVLTRVPTCA